MPADRGGRAAVVWEDSTGRPARLLRFAAEDGRIPNPLTR